VIINAQWQNKASGFTTPNRGIFEMIAIGNDVAWAVAYDGTSPITAPVNDFTRTTDGGNHWTAGSISAFPDFDLVGIAPVSATLCYASIANLGNGNAKIVKTTNGGATWVEQLNYDFGASFGFFADIYFFNANDGLIYGDQSNGYITIFTTHDGGTHWTRVPQANLPAALPDEASYIFSSEGLQNTFWTVSTAGRVWKTTDKGLHWAAYQTQDTLIDYSNLKMRDALHGIWGVHDELYRTNDGGITWTEITPAGTWFTDDLAYVPGTASTFVSTGSHDFSGYGALHGIGTSYSLDDGNTWITIDTAVEHLAIAMVNSYTGYTGGFNTSKSSSGIYKYNGSALGYECEKNMNSICHKEQTICVENGSIDNHLRKGDLLGTCPVRSATTNEITLSKIQLLNKELNVYPNPVVNSATISFSTNQISTVSLQIFDISGRLVITLASEQMQQGNHEVKWNVNDDHGNTVPSGIYLLKMYAGNYSITKKISVIK
jgi:Secretion system C-terminal sorting domain/Photosynthesis system II assembly factor YCF48